MHNICHWDKDTDPCFSVTITVWSAPRPFRSIDSSSHCTETYFCCTWRNWIIYDVFMVSLFNHSSPKANTYIFTRRFETSHSSVMPNGFHVFLSNRWLKTFGQVNSVSNGYYNYFFLLSLSSSLLWDWWLWWKNREIILFYQTHYIGHWLVAFFTMTNNITILKISHSSFNHYFCWFVANTFTL